MTANIDTLDGSDLIRAVARSVTDTARMESLLKSAALVDQGKSVVSPSWRTRLRDELRRQRESRLEGFSVASFDRWLEQEKPKTMLVGNKRKAAPLHHTESPRLAMTFSVRPRLAAALTVALAACILVACPPVTPTPDYPTPVDGATCETACKHLSDLGCPEGKDVRGTTCAQACEYYMAPERGSIVDTGCLAGVTTCDQVPLCKPRE